MKEKPIKNRKAGRPREYPNLRVIANRFVMDSKAFDQEGWTIKEAKESISLHGFYIRRYKSGEVWEKVPFRLMFPRFCHNPVEQMKIKFKNDKHNQYVAYHHKLKQRIEALYYEQLNTKIIMEAKILKTDFTEEVIYPKDKTFSLAELYRHCDCSTIDIIPLLDDEKKPIDKLIVIDEEGKFRDPLVANIAATSLWWRGRMTVEEYRKYNTLLQLKGSIFLNEMLGKIDFIAGQVVLCDAELIR